MVPVGHFDDFEVEDFEMLHEGVVDAQQAGRPMPRAPGADGARAAAAMASTSRSNGQLSVVIWETDTRCTARR